MSCLQKSNYFRFVMFGLAAMALVPVLSWAVTDDLGNAPITTPNQIPGQIPGQAPGQAPSVIVVPGGNSGTQVVPGLASPGVLVPGVTPPATPDLAVPEGVVVVPQVTSTPDTTNAQNATDPRNAGEPGATILPVTPVAPGTVPVQPIPVQPVPVAPVPVQPVPVQPSVPAGQTPPSMLSPADFLLKTEDVKPPETKADVKPELQPAEKPKVSKPEAKVQPKAEPAKKPQGPPVKGEQLMIPEAAKQTGDLSFLEGCWKGERPEYHSKRMITERFCFDDKGVGKRTISDPKYAGTCVGATKAVLNEGGVLQMASEQSYCTAGDLWGSADMICRGEGNSTPCTWKFKDVGGNAQQAYSIRFVRD